MKGWKILKLDDLCEFKNGLWTGKKPPYQNVGVIRNTNFTKDGYLDDSDIAYLDVEIKQYTTRKLEFGDIILEKSGGGPKQPVGRVISFTKDSGDFSFSNFTSVVRIRDREKIDYRYLHKILYFFYISGVTEPMQTHSTGIRNLQLKDYKNLSIPIPPLPEQKRIVSIVDEAFEAIDIAIDNTKQNLTNARELFDSYLNAIFTQKGDGWKEKKLDEIGGKVSTGPFGSLLHKSDYISGGIPIVNPANIEENKIIPNFNKTISPDVARRMHAYILKENDVVVGRRGEIGRCAVVGEEEAGWLCGSGSFFINPFKNVNSIFLAHLIRSTPYRSKLEELASGATMLNLSNQSLSDLVIAMPSLEEQNQITNKLDDLRTETQRLEAIYQQKLTALNELKQSILHKAFTGELTADKADLMTNIEQETIAI
jgi:type I restriction enzyme, S subunit